MNTMNDQDNEFDNVSPADKPATPSKVGVYDRPERRGLSPMMMIIVLILALIVGYFLWQFVF